MHRIGLRFAAFFRATTPDPFVLAVGLTLVVFGLAAVVQGVGPVDIVRAWQGDQGFWSLLAFGMQMVLILVTGHALTSAPIVRRGLLRIAGLAKSARGAAALVAAVAIAASLINWGLGLIVGAIIARDVGRACRDRGIRVHYPVLAAAGYTGLMCWHGGLSGSAPLKVTTKKDLEGFLSPELAASLDPIPFSDTVFSTSNLVLAAGLLIGVPLLCAALMPGPDAPDDGVQSIDEFAPNDESTEEAATNLNFVERLERSPIVMLLAGVPLLIASALWVRDKGFDKLDPNALNLMFLTLGLFAHGSLYRYGRAVGDAVKGASGIVLQFPFYAGIMGVMRTTGLAATFAKGLAAALPASLFPLATMLSAAVINLFVPSGGGQWAVQGPIALEAAQNLGVSPAKIVMAVAYGDQLTNMLQPFWALPLLGITGVKARDVIGYTAVLMLFGLVWLGVGLLVL